MECLKVDLGENSYPIFIGHDILDKLGEKLDAVFNGTKIMIISNPTVFNIYGSKVEATLTKAGYEVVHALISDGEEYKSINTANDLWDACFHNRLDRKSLILALGGGVVGDIAGFIAATYMRGIPFVQVPTTLLAQVDSSVGGKVAVNHPQGKNIIGAFYQPKLVFIDTLVLSTLPERELKTGLAEVIKYGVIWDAEFFNWLKANAQEVRNLEQKALQHMVLKSCAIKAKVVSQDERENGIRAILNYGHTFGHAYEALTKYETYTHGEAVAIGMISAAITGNKLNKLSEGDIIEIINIIKKYGLVTTFGDLAVDQIIDKMYYDKKTTGGKITYIIPVVIGKVEIIKDIPLEIVDAALTQQQEIVSSV